MKKVIVLIVSVGCLIFLQNCSSTKKASASKPAVVSYEKDIMPMLKASCRPCHFPPDGSKQALNTYTDVKANLDEILIRVKLPKDNPAFMPFRNKKPALSDSAINVLIAWQKQNMPQ